MFLPEISDIYSSGISQSAGSRTGNPSLASLFSPVRLEDAGDFGHQRVVWVGITEQRTDREQHLIRNK